jgi:hypothetical protein
VEINVENLDTFEHFVEYMFRILEQVFIACVGKRCHCFEELKKILMIPKMYEKIQME